MTQPNQNGEQRRLSGLVDDLREKLHDTKLHDAKVSLIHKKCVMHSALKRRNWLTQAPIQDTR